MRNKILLIVMAGMAALYWAILVSRLPVFNMISGYFWHFMQFVDKPPGSLWLIVPLTLIAAAGLWLIHKFINRKAVVLCALILLGYLLHLGIGFLDGQGIDGFRARLLTFGHAEFVKLACTEPSLEAITTDYESFLDINPNIRYAPTKPPGQLLFYVLSQKVTEVISPSESYQKRVLKLSLFVSLVWPLLAFMVVWPLYYVARRIYDHETAVMSGILFLFIPSVMLVILHLDQVLYPILFVMTILFAVKAGRESNHALAVINGIFIYLSLYVSFSLIVAWPVTLALLAMYSQTKFRWRGMALSVIGTLVMHGLFYLLFRYDAIERYTDAMMYHQAWKLWQPGISESMKYGLLNLTEYFCWMGLPLATLFVVSLAKPARNLAARRFNEIQWFSIIAVMALAGMAFLGQTKGEVARLWIFMTPLVCMVAAAEIKRRFPLRYDKMILFTIALQFVTIMLMKHIQDFW